MQTFKEYSRGSEEDAHPPLHFNLQYYSVGILNTDFVLELKVQGFPLDELCKCNAKGCKGPV